MRNQSWLSPHAVYHILMSNFHSQPNTTGIATFVVTQLLEGRFINCKNNLPWWQQLQVTPSHFIFRQLHWRFHPKVKRGNTSNVRGSRPSLAAWSHSWHLSLYCWWSSYSTCPVVDLRRCIHACYHVLCRKLHLSLPLLLVFLIHSASCSPFNMLNASWLVSSLNLMFSSRPLAF